jgi:predicted Zn finger-like uncharacterized protein
MATMIIECPSCGRKLRVPDELLGKAVKCPTCEHMFAAPPVQAETAQPDGFPPAPEPAFSQPPNQDTDFVRCSNCAERNDKNATLCRYCGEALKPPERETNRPSEQTHPPAVRRDAEPHRGSLVLTLGIISIALGILCGMFGLPCGIAAWVMGRRDLIKIRQRLMDPAGEGLTQAGWICGIIGTILDSLWLLGCLSYFALVLTFTLGMRPRPPVPPPVPVRPMPVPAAPAPAPAGNKAAVLFVPQLWMRG